MDRAVRKGVFRRALRLAQRRTKNNDPFLIFGFDNDGLEGGPRWILSFSPPAQPCVRTRATAAAAARCSSDVF